MMSKLFKWGSLALAGLGFFLFIYGLADRSMLSLGQTLMSIGAQFLVGGLVLFALNGLGERLNTVAHILSDVDSSLSMQQHVEPTMPSYAPQAVGGAAVAAAAVVASRVEKVDEALAPLAPLEPHKREYFNDLAKYLEPLPEAAPPALIVVEPEPIIELPPVEVKQPETTSRLNDIAKGFPELDALLNKKATPIQFDEPKPMVELEEVITAPVLVPVLAPALIREGQINGIPFRLFSDGTIDGEFSNGSHKFATLAEFRQYVEQ